MNSAVVRRWQRSDENGLTVSRFWYWAVILRDSSKKLSAHVSYDHMKPLLLLTCLLFTGWLTAAERYDFRASTAYAKLSAADRLRLEQVRRDQFLLWGALDLYADEHDDEPPETLDALVPKYLAELPSDPFVTKPVAEKAKPGDYTPSKSGLGYRFMKGAPGNRAWIISSVGLPDFPYLGERNSGLYICKGTWISGMNPQIIKK